MPSTDRNGGGPLNGQCSFIKPSGDRCRGAATGQNALCWAHDPKNAERRRQMASKAGRSKPSREVATLKEELRTLIADVRSGELDRNDAAVMIQAYRALKDLLALERQVKETDELAAEIALLKREYGTA